MTDKETQFKVGDTVRIIYGREVGRSGTIVMVLQQRGGPQYVVEYGNGHRAYCSTHELILEKTR